MQSPQILGILNATPDSFYDGGKYPSADRLIARGVELAAEGADWIDIGGESTRPGANPVSVGEELERVIPVTEGLVKKGVRTISVDTTKAIVAKEAIRAGATMVNDVSAFRGDSAMAKVAAESGAFVVLMHSRGTPQTMQSLVRYDDVVADVMKELKESIEKGLEAGIDRSRIIVDPGFGFAKTAEQSLQMLKQLSRFSELGFPVMVGLSRKSFIGALTGEKNPEDRLPGSLAAAAVAFSQGASFFRVHDVRETRQILEVFRALIIH